MLFGGLLRLNGTKNLYSGRKVLNGSRKEHTEDGCILIVYQEHDKALPKRQPVSMYNNYTIGQNHMLSGVKKIIGKI